MPNFLNLSLSFSLSIYLSLPLSLCSRNRAPRTPGKLTPQETMRPLPDWPPLRLPLPHLVLPPTPKVRAERAVVAMTPAAKTAARLTQGRRQLQLEWFSTTLILTHCTRTVPYRCSSNLVWLLTPCYLRHGIMLISPIKTCYAS